MAEPAKGSQRGQQGRGRPSKRPGEDRVSRRREALSEMRSDHGFQLATQDPSNFHKSSFGGTEGCKSDWSGPKKERDKGSRGNERTALLRSLDEKLSREIVVAAR